MGPSSGWSAKMTTATHFAYNGTLGSKRRRAGEGGGTAEGAHLTAAGAIFQLDNVHLSFPFCIANKAQAKAEALLTGGGWVMGAVGETAAMYVWQQQAINQLTVQKNCRKLLDIYGQRTQSREGAERKSGRTRGVP